MHTRPFSRFAPLAAALLTLAACKGAEGPAGPPGAQGERGPQGPVGGVNRLEATGVIPGNGRATLSLPTSAFAGGTLPLIACYMSNDRATWINVSQLPSSTGYPYCGIAGVGSAAPIVSMLNVPPGYYYDIIAVW